MNGEGTVFAINTNGTSFTNLHSFSDGIEGSDPASSLILSGNTLYGTTRLGGTNEIGTIFAVKTDGRGFTNLYYFTALSGSAGFQETNSDGAFPQAGLILSGNTLYGTAYQGGASGNGTVFAINTDGTGFKTLHSFTIAAGLGGSFGTNNDGVYPRAALTLSGNILYGTASSGGAYGYGTVFAINTEGTGFTNLYNFTGGSDGAEPFAGLILSGNTLYGTTSASGNNGYGTVFALTIRVPAPIPLHIQFGNNAVVLSWSDLAFSLQAAATANGVYTNVPGAVSPYTNAVLNPSEFFRLKAN